MSKLAVKISTKISKECFIRMANAVCDESSDPSFSYKLTNAMVIIEGTDDNIKKISETLIPFIASGCRELSGTRASFINDAWVNLPGSEGVYYIQNNVNEYSSMITGYFPTLEEAMEALKDCTDWYRSKGTGKILFRPFGLDTITKEVLVYEN